MTDGRIYIDQNVLGNLSDPDLRELLAPFRKSGTRFFISQLHLSEICRSSDPLSFVPALEFLQSFVIDHAAETALESTASAEVTTTDYRATISSHCRQMADFERSYFKVLLPLVYSLGGISELTSNEILERFLTGLDETLCHAVADVSDFNSDLDSVTIEYVNAAKVDIIKSFSEVSFENSRNEAVSFRKRVQNIGSFSQLESSEVVAKTLSLLDDKQREPIEAKFPSGFACGDAPNLSKLKELSFMIACMGVIPGTGRMLRGSPDAQLRAVTAQFFDCCHIGIASTCHAFLTFDRGAHRLAKCVYDYAGASTQSILLKRVVDH